MRSGACAAPTPPSCRAGSRRAAWRTRSASAISEPLSRIDSKYGNPYTCLGATAAILAIFGVMATVPVHAQHLVRDESLVKTLRCVAEQLDHWRSGTCTMAEDAWQALDAERRALQRATDGARLALYVWQDVGEQERLQRQISWARIAAFPAHTLVNAFTQSEHPARHRDAVALHVGRQGTAACRRP